ncbi:hypothetical protein [Mameliella alba]|uniref:hypothetical protein n=1 Tax=Mameliella alba TaxID=561184 RepID=UPI000B53276C|nr:hypothetical protein [Mameliella alba]OWV62928.1 hypothetical protein CDZ98_01790 [Mameliella alba]
MTSKAAKTKRKAALKRRAQLLAELEQIVGSQCYNGNIQNWGPGGAYEGQGRSFRYPLTLRNANGEEIKSRNPLRAEFSPEELSTGHYKFGANKLHIIRGLDEVLRFLEENKGLKV